MYIWSWSCSGQSIVSYYYFYLMVIFFLVCTPILDAFSSPFCHGWKFALHGYRYTFFFFFYVFWSKLEDFKLLRNMHARCRTGLPNHVFIMVGKGNVIKELRTSRVLTILKEKWNQTQIRHTALPQMFSLIISQNQTWNKDLFDLASSLHIFGSLKLLRPSTLSVQCFWGTLTLRDS